jgi:hypothetical protein
MGHGVRAQRKKSKISELLGQAQSSVSPHSIPTFLRTAAFFHQSAQCTYTSRRVDRFLRCLQAAVTALTPTLQLYSTVGLHLHLLVI